MAIDKVGVTSLKYPVAVKDKDNEIQHTIATISMTVDLPKEFKGTHMSRFVEILQCKETTLAIWKSTKRYTLPCIKIGKNVRYKLSDVLAFIERNTQR